MGKVYAYVLPEKRESLSALLQSLGLQEGVLVPGDLSRTLEQIVGSDARSTKRVPGADPRGEQPQAPPFYRMPEVLLFCGLTDEELDRFLDAYRESALPAIVCRAVVTPFNLGWTLYRLIWELEEEHRSMG